MDRLTHRWGLREGEIIKKTIRKHERRYIDFIVSGQPLSDILQTKDRDMVSMFGWTSDLEYEKRTLGEYLGQKPTELETGRTIIYGCSECGDIGCGAITAEIVDLGDKIVWQKFGYETDYSGVDLGDFENIQPFKFDKSEYIEAFEDISKELKGTERQKG